MATQNDIFEICGFERATGKLGSSGNGRIQYLPITFVESKIINYEKKGKDVSFVLPFNHDKSIQDSLSMKISNGWASQMGGTIGTIASDAIQGLASSFTFRKADSDNSDGTIASKLKSYLANKALFEYDAGSTRKTIQIPFIVPLALATSTKLYDGAATKVRKVFNVLQGVLYPTSAINFYPPLLEMTFGGMYQHFFGFISSVSISPSNNDMFMDPDTGEYFNMVYEGTITFDNLFMYYHESSSDRFDIDNDSKEVLFGDQPLENGRYSGYDINGHSNYRYYGESDVDILFRDYYAETSSTKRADISFRIEVDNEFDVANYETWKDNGQYIIYNPVAFQNNQEYLDNILYVQKLLYSGNVAEIDVKASVSSFNEIMNYYERKYKVTGKTEYITKATEMVKKFAVNPLSINENYKNEVLVQSNIARQNTGGNA